MTPREFVNTYKPFAYITEAKTELSAVFVLAQAAHESGWAKHAVGNMFFGVKASRNTPENKRQLLTTSEFFNDDKQGYRFPQVLSIEKHANGKYKYRVKDWFVKYATPEESFTEHANFFFKYPRYKEALKDKTDPCKFADGVAKAGYATDPDYAGKLKSIIKTIENLIGEK